MIGNKKDSFEKTILEDIEIESVKEEKLLGFTFNTKENNMCHIKKKTNEVLLNDLIPGSYNRKQYTLQCANSNNDYSLQNVYKSKGDRWTKSLLLKL